MNWLKYSDLCIGIVFNPFRWQFGFVNNDDVWTNYVFKKCLHLGPVWIRIIIDDGRW